MMYPNIQRYAQKFEIEDLIPWWRKGDPPPPWVIDNELIFRRFVDVEVQFRIKELDVLQQQIALQKDKLVALNEVMAGKAMK